MIVFVLPPSFRPASARRCYATACFHRPHRGESARARARASREYFSLFTTSTRAVKQHFLERTRARAHPTTFPGTHAPTRHTRARVQYCAPHVSTPFPPPPCSSLVGGNLFLLIKSERAAVRSVALRVAVRSVTVRSVALRAALHMRPPRIRVETRVTLIVEK